MKNAIALMCLTLFTSAYPAQAGVRENGGFIVPAAAKIEFVSPGNGIDHDLKTTIDALIQEYKNAGLVQVYTEKRWGIEGEVTLCVQLNDLEASRTLNQQLVELVKTGQRKTNLKFVASCEDEVTDGPFRHK
jgi:hypothetical protein